MIAKKDKNADRRIRHERVREKVFGTGSRPRLNVYRSTVYIYAQVIDDVQGITLASASSLALNKELTGKTKTEAAKAVGNAVAKVAIEKGITEVVFDRGGYIYTGRVKAVADGAREAGLKF
ncbi:MAG: 50S ribosomal protein L18 [Clostridia bacterium]